MYETSEDLAELQRTLDESYDFAGEHLRSLFPPERRSSAAELAEALKGAFMINLATVTARCEPVVAPVDGLFYRGRLWFSLARGTVRAAHLQTRPQVSATYVEGDPGACLMIHGVAREIGQGNPFSEGFDEYARELYGPAIDFAKVQQRTRTGPDFTGYIEPRRIYARDFPESEA